MKSMYRKVLFVIVLLVTVIASWNYFSLHKNISEIAESDSRNDGISVFVHYKWFVNPSVIIFDIRDVSSTKSTMDVSRVLLLFSKSLKEKSYDRVILAFKGDSRFMLKGDFFRKTGKEYGTQNPVYTLRTLPQNVYNLDGGNAFSKWSGGLLGVLGKQMEDLSEFHKQWYLTALITPKP
jgi:hypothetical protein